MSLTKRLHQIKLAILLSTTPPQPQCTHLFCNSASSFMKHFSSHPLWDENPMPAHTLQTPPTNPDLTRLMCFQVGMFVSAATSWMFVSGHSSWTISPCALWDQWYISENAFVCYLHYRPQDPICYPEPSFWCNWDFFFKVRCMRAPCTIIHPTCPVPGSGPRFHKDNKYQALKLARQAGALGTRWAWSLCLATLFTALLEVEVGELSVP